MSIKISCGDQGFAVTGWSLKRESRHSWGILVLPSIHSFRCPGDVPSLSTAIPSLTAPHPLLCFQNQCSGWGHGHLQSVWNIPAGAKVSHLTCSFCFWGYKTRAAPHKQKTMHWQLQMEMFHCFSQREIHEDILFTSLQNNISVLQVNISHQMDF